jgi:putative transposase
MQLTQKIRIFPTIEQEDVLWILSEKCRLLYNFALGHRNDVYKETGSSVTYNMQQDELPEIKKKYPEYEWVYSKVLQMVLKGLDADFKSFIMLRKGGKEGKGDKNAKTPGYKGKDYFVTMNYNQSGLKIKDGYIILSHYYKNGSPELKFKIPDDLIDNTDVCLQTIYDFDKIKQITVFREEPNIKKYSEYYLSIVYEIPDIPYKDNSLYQAIDLGINKTVTAVNTEGKFFEIGNPRQDKYWNPIIDSIQSRRDHCLKGSNRWNLLHDLLRKCKKKLHNQIKDNQHKWTTKMVNNTKSNTIIVGDLQVKEMAQSEIGRRNYGSKLNRSTQNQGYLARFVGFLTYKAEKIGKRVIEINERGTSKRCYVCGKIHDMPLWKRTMVCDCGNNIDRDRNSAINIMINFLSQYGLWTTYQKFTDNLRQTGLLVPTWIKSPIGTNGTLVGSCPL